MNATWYDGRTSRGRPVTVRIDPQPEGPALHWQEEDGIAHELAHAGVGWPERFSRGARSVTVDLRDQGSLHFDDAGEWFAAFDAAGGRQTVSERMQTRWSWLLAIGIGAIVLIAAFHQWGTPLLAREITQHVPLEWETQLSSRVLEDLDRGLLHPTKLDAARRKAIERDFASLVDSGHTGANPYPGYSPRWRLLFRSGLGPNALALPGGTVIVTDDLVEEADALKLPDAAIAGVIAHEIGHVVHRHTTRIIVEQAVMNVAFGIATGDITSFLAMTGSALAGLAYHRAHEAQADCFAVALMRREKMPTAPMGELLLALEKEQSGDSKEEPAVLSLLSTHPGTAERARKLREGTLDSCERAD